MRPSLRLLLALTGGAILWLHGGGATAAPVEPDTLVVPQPTTAPERNPDQDINQLLRTELSILEAILELEHSIARRQTDLSRLEHQETILKDDLKEMTERFEAFTEEMDR